MVRHIVMWKIKGFAEGATKAENISIMKSKLEALKSFIPEIKHLEVGVNSPEAAAANEDLVLITDFESFADLLKYQENPDHKKVGEFVAKIKESRACVDYSF